MEKSNWLKIVITTDPSRRELLADFLIGLFNAGVEMEADKERSHGTVTAWFDTPNPTVKECENLVARLKHYLAELNSVLGPVKNHVSWELVEDQDWGAGWKKYFTPFDIVSGITIVPSWEEYNTGPGKQVVIIDPGMAFGTGHHETTSLSLELIRQALGKKKKTTVLDVGTGTGILGMGAVLLGAEKVMAIDNDPDAVAAARENVLRNKMAAKMAVSPAPLTTVTDEYDLVVANIIFSTLIQIADDLNSRLAPKGDLILSGLLKGEQAEKISSVFQAKGLVFQTRLEGDEWAALWLNQAG